MESQAGRPDFCDFGRFTWPVGETQSAGAIDESGGYEAKEVRYGSVQGDPVPHLNIPSAHSKLSFEGDASHMSWQRGFFEAARPLSAGI